MAKGKTQKKDKLDEKALHLLKEYLPKFDVKKIEFEMGESIKKDNLSIKIHEYMERELVFVSQNVAKAINLSKRQDSGVDPPIVVTSITPVYLNHFAIYQMLQILTFKILGFDVGILFLDNMVDRYFKEDINVKRNMKEYHRVMTQVFKINDPIICRWKSFDETERNLIKKERERVLENVSINDLSRALTTFKKHTKVEKIRAQDAFTFIDEYIIFKKKWGNKVNRKTPDVILNGAERIEIYKLGMHYFKNIQGDSRITPIPLSFPTLPDLKDPIHAHMESKHLETLITVHSDLNENDLIKINEGFKKVLHYREIFDENTRKTASDFSKFIDKSDFNLDEGLIKLNTFFQEMFKQIQNQIKMEKESDITQEYITSLTSLIPEEGNKTAIDLLKYISHPDRLTLISIILKKDGKAVTSDIVDEFHKYKPRAEQTICTMLGELESVGILENPSRGVWEINGNVFRLHFDSDTIDEWIKKDKKKKALKLDK